MHVVQIVDRQVFIAKAKEHQVLVTAMPQSVLDGVKDGLARFVPSLVLYYSLEFEDGKQPTRWTHMEVLKGNHEGAVSLSNTLLYNLRAIPNQNVKVVKRSGSVLI